MMSESSARVLRRFRVVFISIKTHFRQIERKAGVGGAQLWALSVIRDNPGIGVNDVAHAMDVHQSTASNLLTPASASTTSRTQWTYTNQRPATC